MRRIENQLKALNLNLKVQTPEPSNVVQLKRRLQRAWRSIEVGTLQSLIQSMTDRIGAVIDQKGNTVR